MLNPNPTSWSIDLEVDGASALVRSVVRAEGRRDEHTLEPATPEEALGFIDQHLASARTGDSFACRIEAPVSAAKFFQTGSPSIAKVWLVKTLFQAVRIARLELGMPGAEDAQTGTRLKAAALQDSAADKNSAHG